ncbi:MAG: glyoxylate/hydroxypyruvate reductase A [Balneolaceae bacterium]|jgi:glyoxylate/hydroxypyruvate reductase|nr:glyoxylate/hydroxypyruvate reductase A [Balneolaceae bacterium]
MSLLLVAKHRDMALFQSAIQKIDPNLDVEVWPAVKNPERVLFAVAWHHPKDVFRQYPNLRAISSLGAGANHLIRDKTIPKSVQIVRASTPSLAEQMGDYITMSVLNLIRGTEMYFRQQQKTEWKRHASYPKKSISVGIMGLGKLGTHAARQLISNGFNVCGWAKSKKEIEGMETFAENQLGSFLNRTNILVCLLPLTEETEGILDLKLMKQLKQPAFLICAGRGSQLVEEDLIYALDIGLIEHAVLDVFSEEPLPESHPFWGRKKITITPHIASITDPDEVAVLLVENYKRLLSGMELLQEVDRNKGY